MKPAWNSDSLGVRPARRVLGFSIAELLVLLAVLGTIAAVLTAVFSRAASTTDCTIYRYNLGSIAKAYLAYETGAGRSREMDAKDVYDFAGNLARYSDLNDPRIWILEEDPLVTEVSGQFPIVVAEPGTPGQPWRIDPDFVRYPLSFAVASKLSVRAPGNTPLAWLRGLKPTGRWSAHDEANPSPFGDGVGLIAFKDGHVELFDGGGVDRDSELLTHYATRQPTADIREALSPGAEILESRMPPDGAALSPDLSDE